MGRCALLSSTDLREETVVGVVFSVSVLCVGVERFAVS